MQASLFPPPMHHPCSTSAFLTWCAARGQLTRVSVQKVFFNAPTHPQHSCDGSDMATRGTFMHCSHSLVSVNSCTLGVGCWHLCGSTKAPPFDAKAALSGSVPRAMKKALPMLVTRAEMQCWAEACPHDVVVTQHKKHENHTQRKHREKKTQIVSPHPQAGQVG